MIQFNLLPAIKMEYIKARRTKRLVMGVSTILAAGSISVLLILFVVVNVWQKARIKSLNNSIKTNSQKLAAVPDLDKILTIQNQLGSLTGLHDESPLATRLFTFLSQVTPANVSIGKLDINFEEHTMTINGGTDALSTVNKFIDTLKFTTYTNDSIPASSSAKAFNSVVLTNFGKTEKSASYAISLNFESAIFDNASDTKLVVPKLITSRSETEKPAALFQQQGASQ